ncbi:MAG: hypothetical protein ACI31W_05155 [Lactococcus sp.]
MDFEKMKAIYTARSGNLILPVVIILMFILSVLGIKGLTYFLMLGFTIIYHRSTRKAGFKGRYDVPFILCYVVPVIDIAGTLLLVSVHSLNLVSLYLMAILAWLIYLVAIIFFFVNAHQIKKEYPTITQDYKNELISRKGLKK